MVKYVKKKKEREREREKGGRELEGEAKGASEKIRHMI